MLQTNDCPYDLRNPRILSSEHKSSIKYGINTIAFKGPEIWVLFKSNTKQIQSLPCHCKICCSFIANLGYTDWCFFVVVLRFLLQNVN